MINWNEVTVGETEIACSSYGVLVVFKIMAVDGDVCWCKSSDGVYYTHNKNKLNNWTIYDPWEEITNQCVWYKSEESNFDWEIWYQNKRVPHENGRFKSDGRRVWTRKEG